MGSDGPGGRWEDFASLCRQMGPNRSCWCLWWRLDPDRPREPGTAQERSRVLVESSAHPVGLIAYADDSTPVGWASVSPREEYPRLQRGRDTAPVDDRRSVWAVPCLFVVAAHRGEGVAAALVEGAVALARACGASALEGVPGDPATRSRTATASYTGTVGLFARAGFVEVARRTPKGRVVMRRELDSPR